MVKAQQSALRKSSHCLRRQSGGRMEVETEEVQPNSQPQSQGGAQSPDQSRPPGKAQTKTSTGNESEGETPMEVQKKGDSRYHAQAKTLWKPIPPLQPQEEHQSDPTPSTRDQSCQTEELQQQSIPGSSMHIPGTSQLKHMLLREVDTIFECKICRSLFRGLPNLITHKEYYCLPRLSELDGPSGDDRQSVAVKDLLDGLYPRKDQSDYVVRLEPIQTTTKAVFQYVTTEEDLSRYPQSMPRQSPVEWGDQEDVVENQQLSQPGGPESHSTQSQGQRRQEAEEEAREEAPQPEEEGSTSGVEDVTISCCLCGKDFNSRRSIRRHCREMHQTKLEELRKFTETRTVPTSLLSLVKGRPRTLNTPTGKSCPVCFKTFATKANVRRHFDEVHCGMRRDSISPDSASRPSQPLSPEGASPRKGTNASQTRGHIPKTPPLNSKGAAKNQNQAKPQNQTPAQPQYNLASCRCLLCKKNYSSQVMLKRHMRIVHKIYNLKGTVSTSASAATPNGSSNKVTATQANNVRVKKEVLERSDSDDEDEDEDIDSSPASSPGTGNCSKTVKVVGVAAEGINVKEEETLLGPKPTMSSTSVGVRGSNLSVKMPKLSVGFDFKQLFCKLCKRQFSSRQNLTKHIELHTDGNDIFIKFYRCPLCRYESRRKRDVLRHVTVVHKKSSGYLAKIMPKLESRAVKRPAEVVLNNSNSAKRVNSSVKEEVNGRHTSSSSSPPSPPSSTHSTRKQDHHSSSTTSTSTTVPVSTLASSSSSSSSPPPPALATRKQQELSSLSAFTLSPPVTRKQDKQQTPQQGSSSPPLTRRSDKLTHHNFASSSANPQTPHTRRNDAQSESSSTGSTSNEVKVTKNFSLHACDQCGRAFAKKLYLESHKRSHRNAAVAAAAASSSGENRRKGVSTRSKALLW
ncbi:zinc finger protein 800-like [Lampris incognitus]|uniref:zinc finger protein 800-like n=1 Tax=Lampris incognitus TaxID=2546036 RepID=UPI0024B52E5C|nr:zinc finger protein 800-like [Lampris incognitus]